jgi:chemotaxis response regulator CheB/chemotaxis methyl-accepting protein methylase
MKFDFTNAAESVAAVQKVCAIVSEMAGIQLGPKQYDMVENRLQSRMIYLQINNHKDYMLHLFQNLETESLALVSLMTTHYTYFFREFNHFEYLLNKSLPQLIKLAESRSDKTIHIWSAACSTGEEGYSLALFFHFHLAEIAPHLKFKVYGTDIDPECVQKAQNGVYRGEELTQSPSMYIRDQFVKGHGNAIGFSKVKKQIKDHCEFSVCNIFESDRYQSHIKFDIIFCRNVFIYFNQDQVKEITNKLLDHMQPEGFLFTGISESLTRLGLNINTIATSVYQHKNAEKQVAVKTEKIIQRPIEVLCVDDSSTILNLMKRILTTDKGYVVKATAKNGREALAILQTQKFDAITLDLHMPEVDGIEFLKQFNHQIPVMVVSSVNREDISLAQKAISLGAADYVEKPSLDNMVQGGNEICAKLKMIVRNFKKPHAIIQNPVVKNSVALKAEPLKKIKVLIVDDSLTVLNLLAKMISSHPQIEVVAKTAKPLEVENLIQQTKPDVITMDIHMPDLDGLTLLRIINAKYHIPTIMISSMNKEDSELVLKAMQLGAIDFIQKPNLAQVQEMTITTCERIMTAANANIKNNSMNLQKMNSDNFKNMNRKIVLLGASTGGTEAIRELLQKMPPQIPPILIVQHIPEHFSAGFAQHLNDLVPFDVKEARDGDILKPNQVLIAPGGKQMSVNMRRNEYFVEIKNDLPVNRHRPSVDYLFKSAIDHKIPVKNILAVLLTGMGADGAAEMKNMHSLGVKTIAQNEATSVVFGMPREAIKLGAVDYILPLEDIADQIIQLSTESVVQNKKAS